MSEDSNLTEILKQWNDLKGQFVITQEWDVERFVAIAQDDLDYYYVTYNGRILKFHTCVGSIIPLKNKIEDKHYESFIRIAKLNHFDQVSLWGSANPESLKVSIEHHKSELCKLKGSDKFLTEICWDIN